MPEIAVNSQLRRALVMIARNRDVALILFGGLVILLTLIMPLPKQAMDVLILINLTVSVLLLMNTVYIIEPLQMSVFPSFLLIATMYRLALNVATTRLVLGPGTGTDKAGLMVQAFGKVVAGNDWVIGMVIFFILIIIQFVVITKGATRISEVAARFALDGMPGKQMSIDADLNAGLIDETEARARRLKLGRETDFYGAMDGASKWVRGDAIASLIITAVNIVGGLYIGMARQKMPWTEAAQVYTSLTIGDGLVSQVPALFVSIAAGLLITRTESATSLGSEVMEQVFVHPKALGTTSAVLVVLGMLVFPMVPTVALAAAVGGLTYFTSHAKAKRRYADAQAAAGKKRAEGAPEKVEGLLRVDPMELEIGYGLIPLVDASQGGDLLERVTMIRRQIALEMGLVVPPIRIRDNMQLEPNEYSIKIRGSEVARGGAVPNRYLAMDSGVVSQPIDGTATTEPAFGLPAVWITEVQRERAGALGYTVVDPTSVIATHLTEIIKKHASDLLTREEINSLLANLKNTAPHLVEEVFPKVMGAGEIQKVLQNLLKERVPIRNLEAILEVLGDYAPRTKDPEILTEYARNALARAICQEVAEGGKIHVVTLDPKLEDLVAGATERTEAGSYLTLPPVMIQRTNAQISDQIAKLVTAGHGPVLLCSPRVRLQMRRLTLSALPSLVVLSYNEIVPEMEVESMGMAVLPE